MSGVKTRRISINQNEYDRLRRQARQAASLSCSVEALRSIADRSASVISDLQRRNRELRDAAEQAASDRRQQEQAQSRERQALREQLQRHIDQTNRALGDMASQAQQGLERLDRDFRSALADEHANTARLIDEHARATESAMQAMDAQLRERIGEVDARIDQVEREAADTARRLGVVLESDAALLELAREYADTAASLIDYLARTFRMELLLPGRLAQARATLEQARADIADAAGDMPTNAAVARQAARQAAGDALRLQEDAIRAEQAWQASYGAAAQALSTAEAQISTSAQIAYEDEAGSSSVDTDHWTDGDLSALRQRLTRLQRTLDTPDSLTAEDLDGLREAGAQLCAETEESAQFALIAFLASQDRADVAQDLADTMHDRLQLDIVADGYQGGDERLGHRVVLRNPATGFEMVITQYPENENGRIVNRLESDILNYGTNNVEEGDRIARQALESLTDLGFCESPVETAPGFEHAASNRTQRRDMHEWSLDKQPAPVPVHAQAQSAAANARARA